MQPGFVRLLEGLLHDLFGDAVDFDVHLQRRHTVRGAGHLEVHIAEMILITEDIGQHRKTIAFLDETHRNTCDRRLHRYARVHQRKRRTTDTRHRARAVTFRDLETTRTV